MEAHDKTSAALIARHLCGGIKSPPARGELWAVPPCSCHGAEYQLRVVERVGGEERTRTRLCLAAALEYCPVCHGPMNAGPLGAA